GARRRRVERGDERARLRDRLRRLGTTGPREVVPKRHVGSLLVRVLGVARLPCEVGQGDDRVAVLPCVYGELAATELTALPPPVEGMAQRVPALAHLVQLHDQIRRHLDSSTLRATPRQQTLTEGAAARVRARQTDRPRGANNSHRPEIERRT